MQLADAVLTCIFTPLETFPIVLVIAALVQRKRLDPARWAVAVAAFTTEMIFVVRNGATQFVRFTHWTLGDKLAAPLFTINGNPVGSRQLANILLLISIVYAVYRFSIENRRQQAALEQEFKNAAELQQVLIPEKLPVVPGFTVTSAYRPAKQVGGDFFQIIPIEGGSTLVILGDVSGKGLRAAMAVSLIVGAVRALADDYPSPAHLLTQLNKRLFGRLQGGFATCLILLLGPDSTCLVASAGHPAPYLNKDEIEIPGALPLGVSQNTLIRGTRIDDPARRPLRSLYRWPARGTQPDRRAIRIRASRLPVLVTHQRRNCNAGRRQLRAGRRHYGAHLDPPHRGRGVAGDSSHAFPAIVICLTRADFIGVG